MTQEDANSRFQEAINRAKKLATDLTSHARRFDNGSDVTNTDVDNFCSQLDEYETDIHSISDDVYVISDEGISEEAEDDDEEDELVDDSNAIGTGGYEKYEDQAENQKAENQDGQE